MLSVVKNSPMPESLCNILEMPVFLELYGPISQPPKWLFSVTTYSGFIWFRIGIIGGLL
jgi:hypothetical protein